MSYLKDADFMLRLLRQGPKTTNEIIQASLAERGCGITPHSRAADLRSRGFNIVCRSVGRHNGRARYRYQLIGSLTEATSNREDGRGLRERSSLSPDESEGGADSPSSYRAALGPQEALFADPPARELFA